MAAVGLHEAGLEVVVVEARPRVGGRLMTVVAEQFGPGAYFDVGGTWTWSDQPEVRALVDELGVERFAQDRQGLVVVDSGAGMEPERIDLPPPEPGEWRFAGGAQQVCERLAGRLPVEALRPGTRVSVVTARTEGLAVEIVDPEGHIEEMHASCMVLAIPPRLAVQDISFTPDLPEALDRLLRSTPTWMGNALKCVAVYESPFWKAAGLSGTALSSSGPLVEVHDASCPEGDVAALWGFVSPDHAFRDLAPDVRIEAALDQLARMFGPQAAEPVGYFERDWSGDPNTNDEIVWVDGPLVDYGHPLFGQTHLENRLVWAGAETVAEGGGHMEGAVRSGRRATELVLDRHRT